MTQRAQKLIIEVQYKAETPVARPQGTVTQTKGSRPKL